MPNPCLDYLVDPKNFQGVTRLFVLSFENNTYRKVHTVCYLSKLEIKDYNVINDGQNFLDQLVKNDLRTYDNIRKIAIDQGGDCTTGWVLDHNYFNNYFNN